MNRRDSERGDSNGGDERERLARARLAFDQGLREASETGVRAARRLLTPALFGAALVGGTLLALAVLRLVRRPNHQPVLFQVSIQPHYAARPVLPAIGGAVARLALRRLLASRNRSSSRSSPYSRTVEPVDASIAPQAALAGPRQTGSSHRNGSSNGHGHT